MKAKFTLLAILVATFFTGYSQQIPNGSFENWTNSWTPVSWNGVENILDVIVPITGSLFTFKDTTTYTEGTASIKLVTDTVAGPYSSLIGIQPGAISLGIAYLDINAQMPAFIGIPFTYRPDSIIFDYKQSTAGADSGGFKVTLTKNGNAILSSFPGAGGAAFQLSPDTGWTHVALALTPFYINNAYPDTLMVQFVSSATNNPVVGTTLNVDGVRFGYVNQPLSVTTSGSGVICPGDSVTLYASTGTSTNYSYQWMRSGSPISGAVGASYTAGDTGTYSVTIDSSTSTATSQPIVLIIDNSVASLPGLNDTICSNTPPFLLEGTPSGGVYFGKGTTTSSFVPDSVLGLDTIVYTVSDINGCVKSASATVLVENCAGIDNIPDADFSVYPNPATTLLNINSTETLAGFNLQIYDVVGRLVISQELTGQNNIVNVATLANCTYIYRVAGKENNVVSQNKFNVIR